MNAALIKLQDKLGRDKSVMGLHISTERVNAVQVVDYKGKKTLSKAVVQKIDLKPGEDADAATAAVLRSVLSQFSLKKAVIICTVHDPQVFVRKITTPPMPMHELDSAVYLTLKNAFPFSLDEAVLDFRLVSKSSQQGKEKYHILAAACPIKTIVRVQSFFWARSVKQAPGSLKDAKNDKKVPKLGIVKIASFIPVVLALENLAGKFKAKSDETLAVLILGSTVTEMIIYRNSHLEFSRSLSVTGDEITKSMTGAFFSDTGKTELTTLEAEEIKKAYGIPSADEFIQINEKITTQHVLVLMRPKIEQLATEISRSLDYYREELQGGKVDRVLLMGGTSQLKRIDEYLSEELGLEVRRVNPLEAVDLLDPSVIGSEDAAQKMVLAIGAALGNVQGINLLSKGSKNKNGRVIRQNVLRILVLSILVALAGAFLFLNQLIKTKNEQIKSKKQAFSAQLKEANSALIIRQLREERVSWGSILKIFSELPQDIYLNELSMNNDQLLIKGVALDSENGSNGVLNGFITSVKEKVSKDARLKLSRKKKDAADQFEFEIIAPIAAVKQ